MTVLSGGISDGHLWDLVDVRPGPHGGTIKTFVPMLEMTAEDLGLVDFGQYAGHPAGTPGEFLLFESGCPECIRPGSCGSMGECLKDG